MEPPKPPAEKTWSVSFTVGSQKPDGTHPFSWVVRLRVIDVILLCLALVILVLEPLLFFSYIKSNLDACSRRPLAQTMGMPSDRSGVATDDPVIGPPGDLITHLNVRDPSNLIMRPPSYPAPEADIPLPPHPKDEEWSRVVESAKSGSVQKAKRARGEKEEH
ncbi:MAG: hypothetical protein HYV15_02560 [Elusimicrobia bacterium]|nr:hypothetical protein [Elusimicrobiota bacterium]